MIINLKAICDSTDMSQKDFANLTGISRYTVWKATEPKYNGLLNVTADRFYQIHCSVPELLPLPEDFFHYTRPIFMINKYLNHYSKEQTLVEVTKRLYDGKYYFLYPYKDAIDRLFPKMFLPYYRDDGNNMQLLREADYIPFDLKQYEEHHISLQTPLTWEQYQNKPEADKALYDRYSTDNIRANLFFRHLQLKDFIGMLTTDLHPYMKEDMSFVQNGELLEKVFDPYITVEADRK